MIKTTFPETYFSVSHSSNNGSYHLTKALKSGKTVLHAVLASVKVRLLTKYLIQATFKIK